MDEHHRERAEMNPLPSAQRAACAPVSNDPAQMQALAQACQSLWSATLSLMTAFMQTPAPAHRLMLARRIACNFCTLADQPCFDDKTRASFSRLNARWTTKVERLTSGYEDGGALGWLRKLLPH
jgi:hypothetical protein